MPNSSHMNSGSDQDIPLQKIGIRSAILNRCKNELLPAVCARIPDRFFGAITRANPLTAYYHMVSDGEVPHVKHLYPFRSVREFEKDLETFRRRFRLVTLNDLLESIRCSRSLPPKSLLLTFDDGFSEMHDIVAPLLWKQGIPATFFIISGCLDNLGMAHYNEISLLLQHLESMGARAPRNEILVRLSGRGIHGTSVRSAMLLIDYPRKQIVEEIAEFLGYDLRAYLAESRPYLTSEQVRKLIDMGFAIGAHSIDHPKYSLLSLDEQLRQTVESLKFIRHRFGLSYGAFAFPHGDDKVTAEFVEQAGGSGGMDVSFGTAGILREEKPRHFQRFSPENSQRSADHVLGRYYARSLYKKLVGSTAHQGFQKS
jgi:peptidoglycan/xylan/chitin deacetylase (PgdA/CDA1 family)